MVMEEQKDNLELTESSLDKQEQNIQEINSAEAQLEENAENVDEVNALEEMLKTRMTLMRWSSKNPQKKVKKMN